jgi:hypothetical protein
MRGTCKTPPPGHRATVYVSCLSILFILGCADNPVEPVPRHVYVSNYSEFTLLATTPPLSSRLTPADTIRVTFAYRLFDTVDACDSTYSFFIMFRPDTADSVELALYDYRTPPGCREVESGSRADTLVLEAPVGALVGQGIQLSPLTFCIELGIATDCASADGYRYFNFLRMCPDFQFATVVDTTGAL